MACAPAGMVVCCSLAPATASTRRSGLWPASRRCRWTVELWLGRGSFERLSGLVRRKVPDHEAWREVRFMVFDLPLHAADFNGRLQRLREIFATLDSPTIGLVEQRQLASREALMALLHEVVEQGGEGLMLRKADAPYRAGRSATCSNSNGMKTRKPRWWRICRARASSPTCSARSWWRCRTVGASGWARASRTRSAAGRHRSVPP